MTIGAIRWSTRARSGRDRRAHIRQDRVDRHRENARDSARRARGTPAARVEGMMTAHHIVLVVAAFSVGVVACAGAAPEADDAEGSAGAVSGAAPKKDTSIVRGEHDCRANGDSDCAGLPAIVGPDGKEHEPECYYLAKNRSYECSTYSVVADRGAVQAPRGALNGKVPGSGALCFVGDVASCQKFDPRLGCDEDPVVNARFHGYGTCYVSK
jgi:hypothetical protein